MGINEFSQKEQYWIWFRNLLLTQRQEHMLLTLESNPEKLFYYIKTKDTILKRIPTEFFNSLYKKTSQDQLEDACEQLIQDHIHVILRDSPGYPRLLHHMFQPPELLYIRGKQRNICNQCMVAIVGMRKPSTYGLRITKQLSESLAQTGICVVSGLAYGIDAEAHRGALASKKNQATIAILTGGLNTIYPEEHEELALQIMEQGCLISEHPPQFPVRAYHVPLRNRLIAGLSSAIIVPEATFQSGSRHTVAWGLDYGRDIFAIPGRIDEIEAQLPNYLIQLGANSILKTEDILDVYQFNQSKVILPSKNVENQKQLGGKEKEDTDFIKNKGNIKLSDEEKVIIELLKKQPMSSDELCLKSKQPIYQLLTYLTKLEQKNMIQKDNKTNLFHIFEQTR